MDRYRRYGTLEGAFLKRYPDPVYATFFEVHDTTGWKSRSADAVAMGLWKSRGLELEGFEFKTDRADWLRELKDPAKSEKISQFLDRWWLCAGDDKVARPDEIPKMWGFLVLQGKSLRVVKKAPELKARPLSRGFMAALLRRGHESVLQDPRVKAAIENAREESRRLADSHKSTDLSCAQRELEHHKRAIAEFEAASGIKLSHYDAGHLGETLKFLRQMQSNVRDRNSLLGRVSAVKETLETNLLAVNQGLESLEKAFQALDKKAPADQAGQREAATAQ